MADKKPGSMIIHLEYADMLRMLNDKDRGKLLLALIDYAQDGQLPSSFKGTLAMSFDVMRRAVDRNVQRYNDTCERNRARANKRWHPEDAGACQGMPSHAPDANSNRNINETQNENKTVTQADTQADTEAAAKAEAETEAQITVAHARKRELLGRLMRGEKGVQEELNRVEIELYALQAELDKRSGAKPGG